MAAERAKGMLNKEADPNAPSGEIFIPTKHDAPLEAGRGIQEALTAKTDSEWYVNFGVICVLPVGVHAWRISCIL